MVLRSYSDIIRAIRKNQNAAPNAYPPGGICRHIFLNRAPREKEIYHGYCSAYYSFPKLSCWTAHWIADLKTGCISIEKILFSFPFIILLLFVHCMVYTEISFAGPYFLRGPGNSCAGPEFVICRKSERKKSNSAKI